MQEIKYKTAKLARELGIKLEGKTAYSLDGKCSIKTSSSFFNELKYPIECTEQTILQKYLRERYKLHVVPYPSFMKINQYLPIIFYDNDVVFETHAVGSYEKALELGLFEALNYIKENELKKK